MLYTNSLSFKKNFYFWYRQGKHKTPGIMNPLAIGKSQLAYLLGISPKTLQRWLNQYAYNDLIKVGYRKTQKILYKPQLDVLFPSGLMYELDENGQKRLKTVINRQ